MNHENSQKMLRPKPTKTHIATNAQVKEEDNKVHEETTYYHWIFYFFLKLPLDLDASEQRKKHPFAILLPFFAILLLVV